MTKILKNKRVFAEQGGISTADGIRLQTLENNELKITYYSVVTGTSGIITPPSQATFNADEFGLSSNAILSEVDGLGKPTFVSPKTSGGTIVTATLNTITGAWLASGVYTASSVALIYSLKIKTIYYSNLTYSNIIESESTHEASGAVSPLTYDSATDRYTTVMNTNKLIGRGTAGSGTMEEITLGTGLSLAGSTLNASGATDLSIANKTATTFDINSSTGTDITVPEATITEAGLLNATDKVKLNNTSGSNTGDQNLAPYLTTATAALTYQPLDSDLTAIAALTTDSFGRDLLIKTSAVNVRSYIGAGTGNGNGDALVSNPLSQFAATTSLQLLNTISDETGTGSLVFATSPTLVTPLLGTPTSGTLTNCTGYTGVNLVLTDVTTNDVSITKHGFTPKAPNDATKYLDGTGGWSIPPTGTTYTFSTGLTNTASTITSNLSTGISGGQSVIGGTGATDVLTYKSTTGTGTTTALAHQFTGGTNGATVISSLYNDGQFLIGTTTRNSTALGILRIGQGTSTIDIGERSSGMGAIWINAATPSTTNFAITSSNANSVLFNGATNSALAVGGSAKLSVSTTALATSLSAASSGSTAPFTFTAPASTNQTASTEVNGYIYSLATNRQWATGALTLQREFYVQQPTYRFVGASTITDAFSFYVDGGPIASTNATITRSWSAGFNGRVGIATNLYVGNLTTAATALLHLGAGTASANTAPLKMTSGALLTTPEVGAQEFLTDEYYVTITTGTARRKLGQTLTGSATLDFPSTLAQTDSDLTITVTGAVVGDPCEVAPPAMPPTGSTYTAFVSAADTVTVRFSVYGITSKDPASGTFNVIVHKNR